MNLFFSVGDYSSELYAEKIISDIIRDIDGRIFVIGGQVLYDLSKKFDNLIFWMNSVRYSAVGFWENLESIPIIYFNYLKLGNHIFNTNIDVAILFDSPALNLRLIKLLKKKEVKIIYIIPPRSWSLEFTNTHKFVQDNCNLIIVPFKFNLKVYKSSNVFYFGHPIVDIINKDLQSNLDPLSLAIFPGSRKFEVSFISKPVFKNIEELSKKFKNIYVSSTYLTSKYISNYLKNYNESIFIEDSYEEIVKRVGLALAVSGTITLKNALYLLPTIAFYKVFKISEFIFKNLVKLKVDKIALPNILWDYEFNMGNEKIIPELIQDEYNYNNLIQTINYLIDNYDTFNYKMKQFRKIFFEFSPFGTIQRISNLIKEYISKL